MKRKLTLIIILLCAIQSSLAITRTHATHSRSGARHSGHHHSMHSSRHSIREPRSVSHTHSKYHHATRNLRHRSLHHKKIAVSQHQNIANVNPQPAISHWHNPTLLNHSIAFADTTKQHLVTLVSTTVQTLRYSVYKLGGSYYNAAKGIYKVDCSTYVDQVLHQADPHAYLSLVDTSHKIKPTSIDYYNLFTKLPDATWRDWQKVDEVKQLQAGDILFFAIKIYGVNAPLDM